MADCDVVIVGAGPAGATAALNLAPFHRVLLVDRWPTPRPRIGEALPGAARRLLIDMGLWQGFLADGHAPRHVHRSIWGGNEANERDALTDPDGHGWQLDRVRFERRLRATAVARGATLLAPAGPLALRRDGARWRLRIDGDGRAIEVTARLIIDAAGRQSRVLSPQGARRATDDRLLCIWLRTQAALAAGVTQIEAEAGGWWYAAALPHGEAVLAFHTDADLPDARLCRAPGALLDRARRLPMLGEQLADNAWDHAAQGACAAHGAALVPPAGPGWIAIGDAALAFDPLSSQGLFNALYTGLAGAETAERMLSGDSQAVTDYVNELAAIRATYRDHLAAWYGIERRWRDRPFWARRIAGEAIAPPPTHIASTAAAGPSA